MSFLSSIFGGGKTTTVIQPAAPSAEELALQGKQLELATFQLEELQRQRKLQTAEQERLEPLVEQFEELLPLQLDLAKQSIERAIELGPLEKQLLLSEIERIERGDKATPEQLAFIKEAADRAIEEGEFDIERFRTETTRAIGQELAPSLGLRPSDSPILDRGALIGAEALRQQGGLVAGVRGAQAQASLNFPLAAGALQSARTQFQQQLLASTTQFQAQLRDAAFSNRLRLSGQTQSLGLGLATGLAFPSFNFPRGETKTVSGGGPDLAGIGRLLSGAGAFGGLFEKDAVLGGLFGSSRELKRDPERSESGMRDITHESTLEKLEDLPVERWRYKEGLGLGGGDHVGPYAEDFKETFGLGDGKTINIIDAVGIGLSATKGLAKKVRLLEHAAHAA